MNKETKIKIYLGTIYIFVLGIFLWFFFNNFSIQEITNYEFIRNYRDFLIKFKQSNFLLILIAYFIFTVVWVLLLGFGSPVAIVAGFIFGKWIGTIVVVSSLAIGATLLYIFANFFVRELIISKFEKKFAFINEKIKKNEFIYFFLYRFIGGIPFFIANKAEIRIKNTTPLTQALTIGKKSTVSKENLGIKYKAETATGNSKEIIRISLLWLIKMILEFRFIKSYCD